MTKKTFYNLDTSWVNNTQINLSAVERRTSTLTKRRTVKKEFQVAWLLKAITLIDLTTLSGDDTFGKVERLCNKALNPIDDYILQDLGIENNAVRVGAVCVYHHLIKDCTKLIQNKIPIAAVSTGFPAGLSSYTTRKKEISECLFSSNSKKISSDGLTIRITGSAALDLAYVSCGRFDGSFHKNLSLWDIAAGSVLVREAGGVLSDIDLKKTENISLIASNQSIEKEINNKISMF